MLQLAFRTVQAALLAAWKATPTPSLRLAYVWAKQASAAEMDLIFRLSMLEGVAGFEHSKQGSWSNNPHAGLAKAKAHFAEATLNPDWLSKADTGLYRMLLKKAQLILRAAKIQDVSEMSADMLVINALQGLSRKMTTRQRAMVRAGEEQREGILSGHMTPMSAGKQAETYIRNFTLAEIKSYRSTKDRYRMEMSDEDNVGDRGIADPDDQHGDPAEALWDSKKMGYLLEELFDAHSALGQRIMSWTRDYLGKQDGDKYYLKWLDLSLAAGEPVKYTTSVAQAMGVAPGGLGRYPLEPVLKRLAMLFWKNPLAKELEAKFKKEFSRMASKRHAARLAHLWLSRRSTP